MYWVLAVQSMILGCRACWCCCGSILRPASHLTQILTLPYTLRAGVHTWLALLLQQTRRCLPSLAQFF